VKKILSLSMSALLIALLSLSVIACQDRAMVPKEEKKAADTATPAAPAPAPEQTPAAPATK
jgi:hypothetical protein